MTDHDAHFMRRAFELAYARSGQTGDNPSVGCVLVNGAGQVVAEAATGDGGRPHAEQSALDLCKDDDCRGGTAYVTLEPCRQRSTDEESCSRRLIQAGLKRVVVAILDRHPKGHGGLVALQDAGIAVEVGILAEDGRSLYAPFFASIDPNKTMD
jgi:pyrimidine deaminase RibD-like protein